MPMIEPEEAWQRIAASLQPLSPVTLPLEELEGHVLATEIVAQEDVPPFAAATVDGWAVIATDSSPRRRILPGSGAAGESPTMPVTPGTAARVMTGAPLPAGADAVVMVEESREQEGWVYFSRTIQPGAGVRPIGADLQKGQRVLSVGTVLGPAEIGLLATLGWTLVPVHPKPRVAILSTGDELVEPSQVPGPSQIRDSNRYSLMAAVRQIGGIPFSMGIARDRADSQRERLLAALEQADVVITSGGVSMGARDFIGSLLAELGTVHFDRVRQKPGKPLTFATVAGKPCFALPGNPVSVLVSFELYVRPALRRLAGHRFLWKPERQVRLAHPVQGDTTRIEFQRAILEWRDGEWWARTTGNQASSRLMSMLGANALLRVPPGVRLATGDSITAIFIAWLEDH